MQSGRKAAFILLASAKPPSQRTNSTTKATSPQRLRELFAKQIQYPVFDPKQLDAPLGPTLHALQAENPPAYLTSSELPDGISEERQAAALLLTSQRLALIAAGRRAVLRTYVGIDQPGGKLYPAERSEACWRDLNAFTRVVGYFCVAASGFSEMGMGVLQEVYSGLDVPVDAVIVGVNGIRDQAKVDAALLDRDPTRAVPSRKVCETLDEAFDALLKWIVPMVDA